MMPDHLDDSLRAIADEGSPRGADEVLAGAVRSNRRRRGMLVAASTTAAVLLAAVLAVLVAGGDSQPVISHRPTTTAAPAVTTTSGPPVSAPTTAAIGPTSDAEEGLRFDYGRVVAISRGGRTMTFDRQSRSWSPDDPAMPASPPPQQACPDPAGSLGFRPCAAGGFPVASGTDWRGEPVLVGNTDTDVVDFSDRTRTYVLADDAELLVIANLDAVCASWDVPERVEPRWAQVTVAQARSRLGEVTGHGQDALTFDQQGHVTRVRLSAGC